jgi:DNA-binding transcriptional LysR family regulator
MYKLSQLRQIVLLSEIGSYRKTAELLGITHSALSYTVKKFEDKYGTTIFVRSGNNTRPTPFGKVLIDSAKIALQTIDDAERGIASMLKMDAGKLVIGADSLASSGPVALAIVALFRDRPEFQYTVLTRTWHVMEQMLRDGLIDVYCGIAPETKANDLDFQSIYVQAPWLVCRSSHPLSAESRRDQASMKKYKVLSGDAPEWYLEYIQKVAPDQLQLDGEMQNLFLTSQDPYLAKAVLLRTDAIGLLPAYIARDEVQSGRMMRLDVTEVPLPEKVELVVARRENYGATPIAMQFSREVKKAAAEISGF